MRRFFSHTWQWPLAVVFLFFGFLAWQPQAAQAAEVTCKVTKPDGTTAISGVYTYLRTANWSYYQSDSTASDGSCKFENVPEGSYKLSIARDSGSASYSPPETSEVTVTTSNLDLGTIRFKNNNVTLKLTTSNDKAVSGTYAYVANSDWSRYFWCTTDTNGNCGFYIGSDFTGTLYLYDVVSSGFYAPANISFSTTKDEGYNFGTIKGMVPNATGIYLGQDNNPIATSKYPSVSIYNSDWSVSKWSNLDKNGAFEVYLPKKGTYKATFWGGNNLPDLDTFTFQVDDIKTVTDLGTRKQPSPNVTVTVTKADATTAIANAYISLSSSNLTNNSIYKYGSTNSSGQWQTYLGQTANYCISVYANQTSEADPRQYCFDFTAGGTANISLSTITPPVKIKVVDPSNNAVSGASCYIYTSNYDWQNSSWTSTGSDGTCISRALDAGTYLVQIYPPWTSGTQQYVAPDPFSVTVVANQTNDDYVDSPVQLVEPKKTLNITVKDQNGKSVTDASVSAWKSAGQGYCSTNTNSQGGATCVFGKGKWNVYLYQRWDSGTWGGNTWGYFESWPTVEFKEDNTVSETKNITITVTRYTGKIKGKVLLPDGSALTGNATPSVSASNKSGFWNWGQVGSDGSFSLPTPPANVTLNFWTSSNDYAAPTATYSVGEGETLDVGNLYFSEKKEFIDCNVRDTAGTGLSGQYCSAWKSEGYGWANCTTDAAGSCTLKVSQGKWLTNAYPAWSSTERYACLTGTQTLNLGAEQTVEANFECALANSTLKGTLQDADGNLINQYGWLEVRTTSGADNFYSGLGASINGGSFEVKVPAGTFEARPWLWNAEWSVDAGTNTFTIGENETQDDFVITMLPNDATISGNIVDQNGDTLSDLNLSLMVENGNGSYQYDWVTDGSYEFNVAAGTWKLSAWVNWNEEYVLQPDQDLELEIDAEEDATKNIVLVKEDSEVTVTAKDNSGNILQNVWVSLDTKLGQKETDSYDYWRYQEWGGNTDQNGKVTVTAPAGSFYVSCNLASDFGYLTPEAQLVTIDADTPASVECVFVKPNATITGTVTRDGELSPAFVYCRSDKDRYREVSTADGNFSLDVFAPDVWNCGAIHEASEEEYFKSPEKTVSVDEADKTYDIELVLDGDDAKAMSEPVTVNFSSDTATTISLENGARCILPAFSMSQDTENITMTFTPKAEIAHESTATPIDFGYDISAIDSDGTEISDLAGDITCEFPFNIEDLEGINAEDLMLLYRDDESDSYRGVKNVIIDVDEDNPATGIVRFTVDHLTYFAVLSTGGGVDPVSVPPQINVTTPLNGGTVGVAQVIVNGTITDPDADMTIELNGDAVTAPELDDAGNFSYTLTGLKFGPNTIRVEGSNSNGDAEPVVRTINYSGEDGTGDETPNTTPTGKAQSILVSPQEGGPHIRVFDTDGNKLTDFFAFAPTLRTSYTVLTKDLDGDGVEEILVAPGHNAGPQVRVFNSQGEFITDFFAYDERFRGGAKIALSDLTGDYYPELIVTPKVDGGPHIRIYRYDQDAEEFVLLTEFFAYTEQFHGGVRIVTADVTGDGKNDLIVTPQSQGGPHVRVFSYAGSPTPSMNLVSDFFAYSETLRMGVKVMAADLNGDGVRDLVTAPYEGSNFGSNVRAFTYNAVDEGFELMSWVMAFGDGFRGAVNIRTGDLNNNGRSDIVVAPHENGGPNVRIYEYNPLSESLELLDWFMAYEEGFHGGVDFKITNVDGDDYAEIVTTPRHKGGPNMRLYEYDPLEMGFVLRDWKFTHNEDFHGQLQVTTSDVNGDGDQELIVSPLENGGPNTRLYDWTGEALELQDWFMAYADTFRGGVVTTDLAGE